MRYIILNILLLLHFTNYAQDYFPKNDGVKQNFKNYTAFTNATVYVSSTQKIEKCTLLIKEDKIIDVGIAVIIPKNAQVIDATGKTIYASFIDLFSEFGISKPQKKSSNNSNPQYDSERTGYYWNDHIKADFNANENINYDEKTAKELRDIGFGTVISHLNDGVIAGTGLLWTLNDSNNNAVRILNPKISQHFTFNRSSYSRQSYPSSLMGSMALLRQFYHDAKWYEQGSSKTKDFSLEAFNTNKKLIQIFNAGDKLNSLRAKKIGGEFNINYIIKGNGTEFERIEEIKKTNATFIISLKFPEPYDVSDIYLTENIALGDLKMWNQAPFNLKVLAENNITFSITAADLMNVKDFLPNLRKAVLSGLSPQKALEALTEVPAKLINQNDKLGTLKKGALANFMIVSGDIFDEKSTIQENWVQGNRHLIEKNISNLIKGDYDLLVENTKYDLKITGENNKFESKIKQNNTEHGSVLNYNQPWISLTIKSTDTINPKFTRLSGMFKDGILQGKAFLENGNETTWNATKKAIQEAIKAEVKPEVKIPKMLPVTFPNIAYGNIEKPKPQTILIKNATIWTGEKEGILKETDLLLENGKISKIGKNIIAPLALVIDGTNKHVTAGIIDEHSHIAISNGVNEGGQNSSAEVTIEDVVDSDDINIYRNLSGGVTTANLLHGSANPIGGRAALIKLKWGFSPQEMLVPNAAKYIKFALGENVKQSNWGDSERYRFPQSRMGVEQVYEDYFTRALEYQKEWNNYNISKEKTKTIPRFDIEMEVLSEILNKKRFITCHSYVQSEINMFIKLAERYKFRIQTFTHILEGYKVADKMAAHGVGGSTFADWWGYKFEVNDAIPYNAAIMNNQGVLVSINSDDAEMSRRLNQEAAKAIKYGNVPEELAWNFITLNPAKLLQVDNKIGSIKIGKDADVVVWSTNPLSIYAKAEKTIIESTIFYDLNKENETVKNVQNLRTELINLMMDAKNKGLKTQIPKKKETKHYHCETLEKFE